VCVWVKKRVLLVGERDTEGDLLLVEVANGELRTEVHREVGVDLGGQSQADSTALVDLGLGGGAVVELEEKKGEREYIATGV
jgi:hypothetical protein